MSAPTGRPFVASCRDSIVLIAGGTSGVGLASAHAFVAAGVRRVALLARDVDHGERARAEVTAHGTETEVLLVPCDATDPTQVQAAVAQVHETFGGVDVLVSSVTSSHRPELLHRSPMQDTAAALLSLTLPPMLLTQAVLPVMRERHGGSIVLVASDAAKVPTPGESILGGAMAAIVMFSRVAALEGKRDGIRVNAVTPSLIAGTPTTEHVLREGFSRRLFEKAAGRADLGVVEAADLAPLVVFLGGPDAAKVTGQVISVNGGISVA